MYLVLFCCCSRWSVCYCLLKSCEMFSRCCCKSVISFSSCLLVSCRCRIDNYTSCDSVSLSIASQCCIKVSVICVIFGCFCICSPVGVVCCSQHFVRNWMWCSAFVRIIFFWCNFRCVVFRSFCVDSLRSLVCTRGDIPFCVRRGDVGWQWWIILIVFL